MTIYVPPAWEPKPLTLLEHSGRGMVSLGIKFGSFSRASHISGVVRVDRELLENLRSAGRLQVSDAILAGWPGERSLLIESTTLSDLPCLIQGDRMKGVQAVDPYIRVMRYPGRIWVYELDPDYADQITAESRLGLATRRLLSKVGKPYDATEAVQSASWLHRLWPWVDSDCSSYFCSELWAEALQEINILPKHIGAADWTPAMIFRNLKRGRIYKKPWLAKG